MRSAVFNSGMPFWFIGGAIVKVVANTNYHQFTIGSKVILGRCYNNNNILVRRGESSEGSWWVRMQDCQPLEERSLEDIVKELLG
jgi:hypothetical protein